MDSKISHIAFDMDGVIYNSEPFIAEAYRVAIERGKLRFQTPALGAIMAQIGKPVITIFRSLFPDIRPEEEAVIMTETLRAIGEMIREGRGEVFGGIPEVLDFLSRNAKLHVCSNGRRQYVETILGHYDLAKYFQPVRTLEDAHFQHKGELLRSYMELDGGPKSAFLMVGDRRADFEAAKFAGCGFVGCLWGHADPHELVGATVLLKEPTELRNILDYYG